MKVVTAQQMREIEHRAEGKGCLPDELMWNAGLSVAREVVRWLGGMEGKSILVLVGPGNNGGDGLAAAHFLHSWGARVHLYLCSPRPDSDHYFRLIQEECVPCTLAPQDREYTTLTKLALLSSAVIDSLFGTGMTHPLQGVFKEALEKVKAVKETRPDIQIVALDLPSGLNPDTGVADPSCIAADLTVALGYPKRGFFISPGVEKVGKLVIADIGLPSRVAEDISTELLTREWARATLPRRPLDADKGTFGKVLVVAGSVNYVGAAYLAAAAATRVGAGLVTLAIASSLHPILSVKLTEGTYLPLPESEPGILAPEAVEVVKEQLPRYNVLLIGCGLGQSPSVTEFLSSLLFSSRYDFPASLILDADALNFLAKVPQWWQKLNRDVIVTPHPGEMSRLTGFSAQEIQAERIEMAIKAAALWQKVVVLKGPHTLIAAPEGGLKISPGANPGLASAGTGDVLAGTIAGFLAQGLSPFNAAACGVYVHSEAGEMVKERLGDAGIVAGDLLPALPLAINKLKKSESRGNSRGGERPDASGN